MKLAPERSGLDVATATFASGPKGRIFPIFRQGAKQLLTFQPSASLRQHHIPPLNLPVKPLRQPCPVARLHQEGNR